MISQKRLDKRMLTNTELQCDWWSDPGDGALWKVRCRFKGKHIISGKLICNVHARAVVRHMERHARG